MKTNKLMTAFALSAMFAACSQDAELNEAIALNDFNSIPMVEANFTVNAGVESRMANGWGWELQDQVGFAWLGDGVTIKNTKGLAYQNNPLYCIDTDGAFKAEGMFYVGKYFAYMPYNEGNHTIEPINFKVSGQTLTTNSADLAKHAIYISPKVYELEKKSSNAEENDKNKLASGIGENLPLTIARVSNAATVNLTFANTEGLTDLKVLGVSLNVTNGAGAKKKSLLPSSFTYKPTTSAEVEEWKVKDDLKIGLKSTAITTYNPGAITATSKEGIAVVDGALSVKMLTMPVYETVVPTANNDNIEVIVTTNYGSVTVTGASVIEPVYADPCITYGQDEDGDEYELTNAPIFNNLGSAGELNVYVDMAGLFVGDTEVATQEALMAALNTLAVSGYEEEVAITVKPEKANRDKNVVLTDFTLPQGLKAKVSLATDQENGFVFNGNTIINNYIKLNTKAAVNGTMTVNLLTDDDDNALVSIEGETITINNDATLVNDGVINNTIITATKIASKAAGLYVSNNAKAVATTITNNGAIKWIAGKIPTPQTGLVYAEVTDFATLAAASAKGVTTARFVAPTVFGNNGLNLSAEFNKIKYIEISAPVTINMTVNSVTGAATTVEFANLDATATAAVQIKTGGSLTVVSDNKDNKIDFGADIKMSLAENTTMNLTKVTFDGIASITNAGNILTSSSKLTATITGSGSSSSVN